MFFIYTPNIPQLANSHLIENHGKKRLTFSTYFTFLSNLPPIIPQEDTQSTHQILLIPPPHRSAKQAFLSTGKTISSKHPSHSTPETAFFHILQNTSAYHSAPTTHTLLITGKKSTLHH